MDNIITADTVYSDCYWTDDRRNAFREAVRAEGQVMASDRYGSVTRNTEQPHAVERLAGLA